MANMVPVCKKSDKQILQNYRPVSPLPICGKVFGCLIYNSLFEYFIENDLHSDLICKLKQNGVAGDLLDILTNFLKERKQRVILNGQYSVWTNGEAGVPQGSILGLLLFLIYINDLPENLVSNPKLFADDTSLFFSNT